MNTHDLVLVRSDTGDGGWSLHPPGSTNEAIAKGDEPTLMSCPAQKIVNYNDFQRDYEGEWDRPNQEDYDHAWRMCLSYYARRD